MTAARDCDQFVCTGCGVEIFSMPSQEPPPTVCATCRWLDHYVADPVEREELRKRLMGAGA